MKLYDWNRLPAEQMNPKVVRKVVHSGQMTIARLQIQKDAVVPEHSHINEQVANVEKGFANRVTFVIGKDGKVTSVIEGKDAIDPTATLSACKPAPKP